MVMRIGQGFDLHAFERDRRLVVCGVELPGERGLAGHSDADVGLHAVTDAILGALAEGDLGEHFPPDDPSWRNAPSSVFVAYAIERASSRGFRLVNCDLTLVGEAPRIARHRGELRRSLAALLGVDQGLVSVKATTTDGLGSLGRGEGLGAIAVVLLEETGK
jgi:2-C-methyl-D-erythritol 4-phosphate cytidylyltransferase/2-C-methyl-D-erythritol 2,4-cyclodiphosphate synthase